MDERGIDLEERELREYDEEAMGGDEQGEVIKHYRQKIRELEKENEALKRSTSSSSSREVGTFRLAGGEIKDLIPAFRPGEDETTTEEWIENLESMREIYEWTDQQVLLYASIRLKGAAKKWHSTTKTKTWDEFKRELMKAFPEKINVGRIIKEIQGRKRKRDETVTEYFFEMRQKGKKIKLDDATIAKYIIAGLGDEKLIGMVAGANYDSPQELLQKIKDAEDIRRAMRKHGIGESGGKEKGEKNDARPEQESQDGNQVQKVSCYNCGKVGQTARECHERENKQRDMKAEITCFKCNEKGHIARFCGKNETDSKMIHKGNMRIIEVEEKENPNYKEVKINEKKLWAYIDQGSDCTTMRKSDVEALGVEIKSRTTTLRGFAGQCQTVGQTEVWVTIDEVRRQTTVHVVPDEAQNIPVIVGLDILGKEDIRVVRQGKTLQIEDVRKDANEKTI
ncbi:uncharacterized protein LOC129797825 [Lutzomyia longipalpis]|uniref:uncharacterized protein LOC129792547 n=1 Tax=Lutzomyia longipalpis TaxID=7200 RepID=UPI002483929E|nr:uncharacterized protein LOC129792547 [Lutzomyia longipalpis]XP_055687651.1 uncharacterized protein LOC129792547 [Lutzomyia longipalpis]XP_055696639.1 uncharacterized protein LOC129797825 [Lutzomyia longipalpis]XP_055696640.1 uncharacterized protein LOC129797825 [Lutzomyia longipalpis]